MIAKNKPNEIINLKCKKARKRFQFSWPTFWLSFMLWLLCLLPLLGLVVYFATTQNNNNNTRGKIHKKKYKKK